MPEDVRATTHTVSGAATLFVASRAWAVMGTLFLVFFLGVSDNQLVSPLLPHLAREFGLEAGDAGKLLGPSYALAAAFAALVIGPASDRYGRRRFLLAASILFAVSLIAVLAVKDIRLLAGLRFLTGFAAGTFSTCSIAYVGDFFPYERRGTAMSVVQSGYSAALVGGVLGGAAIAQWRGWRYGFAAFGVLALVVFWMLVSQLPDDSAQAEPGVRSRRLEGVRDLFGRADRVAAIVSAFFVSAGFTGTLLYVGSWLTAAFGLRSTQVSLIFLLAGVASLVAGLAAGPVADRLGKRGLSIWSTVILAFALGVIPQLEWGVWLFGAFLTAALAFAFRQGPLQALATELVPRNARGSLVALRNTASQVGIAVAAAACGQLYDNHGYNAVGLFSAVTTMGAAACIVLMKEPGDAKN